MAISPITAQIEGYVLNPATTNVPDGQNVPPTYGKQEETLVADIHGVQYSAAMRKSLFTFNVTAVSLLVVGSASVFSLYNPPNSNTVLELVDFDCGLLGADVINILGLYWQGPPTSGSSTFTTPAVFGTNVFGGAPGKGQPQGIAYTAFTHSATPVLIDILADFNTATGVVAGPIHYEFKGRRVLFPGDVVSVQASSTVFTASKTDLSLSWAEWTYPN